MVSDCLSPRMKVVVSRRVSEQRGPLDHGEGPRGWRGPRRYNNASQFS